MDAGKVAENGNRRDIFPVKREDGVAEGIYLACIRGLGGLLLVGYVALQCVVLKVVCGCDFGEEGSDHFDHVVDGHGADIVGCFWRKGE